MLQPFRFSGRLGVGALLACTLAGCHAPEKEAEPVVPVQVSPAIRGSIRQIVTADGVLYPREQANIVPKISAPVRRFLVNRGDRVKQGQLLAELENRDLVAAAAAAKGQLDQAESNYRSVSAAGVPEQVAKAAADLDAAREGLDAAKKLFDSRQQLFQQGAIARKSVDEAQVAYAQAKSQFDTAQQHQTALQTVGMGEQIKTGAAQVESARAQYESAQAQVSYSEIRSPISGVVTDRPIYAGDMAQAGMPLLTVMDVSALVARINMAPDQAKLLKPGDEAMLTPADGGDPVAGKVTIVSPAADANSTTFQVWVQADNADGALRAGASVHAAIVAETIDGALLIPATALLPSDEGGEMVVTVDDKDTAHQKKVMVGAKEGDLAQVTSGLEPGERVVTVGGLGLDDKAKVKVLKPGDKKAGDDKDDDKGDEK